MANPIMAHHVGLMVVESMPHFAHSLNVFMITDTKLQMGMFTVKVSQEVILFKNPVSLKIFIIFYYIE